MSDKSIVAEFINEYLILKSNYKNIKNPNPEKFQHWDLTINIFIKQTNILLLCETH